MTLWHARLHLLPRLLTKTIETVCRRVNGIHQLMEVQVLGLIHFPLLCHCVEVLLLDRAQEGLEWRGALRHVLLDVHVEHRLVIFNHRCLFILAIR